jgi:hypothetical protein
VKNQGPEKQMKAVRYRDAAALGLANGFHISSAAWALEPGLAAAQRRLTMAGQA